MSDREDLDALLSAIPGVVEAYFQPPESLTMQYPCIVYRRDDARTIFANNKPYRNKQRYQVTVMDEDPDSLIPAAVAALPLCAFDRHFTVDQLNHDVYNLYF